MTIEKQRDDKAVIPGAFNVAGSLRFREFDPALAYI